MAQLRRGVPHRQWQNLQQTQHQRRARDPPILTMETLLRTPKSSPSFGSSQEITPGISSKTTHSRPCGGQPSVIVGTTGAYAP